MTETKKVSRRSSTGLLPAAVENRGLFSRVRRQAYPEGEAKLFRKICTALLAVAIGSCTATSDRPREANNALVSSEPAAANLPPRLRSMTQEQYLNTLAYVFGPDVQTDPQFPAPQRTDGLLALGASQTGVSLAQMELYQKAAINIASLVIREDHRAYLFPCKPAKAGAADAACAKTFFVRNGRLLHRRPLTTGELDQYVAIASEASNRLGDFYAGVASALEGMLLSPDVLFVMETTERDPISGKERLDSYSLATRLSLFLWDAAPDDALLTAASNGSLRTTKGLAREVDRMLASPRLEGGVRAFFDDMFGFDSFTALSKDATQYPTFTGATAVDAREETLRVVVDHLITRKLDYRDLYTTRDTFISPTLAVLYHVPAVPTWTRYTFAESDHRAGILTHASFLATHSHPVRSSPTLRGKALRELLLCQPVPRPPANVDFSALENPSATLKTTRDRVAFHLQNPACAGCHKITDPLGLALENFDGVGIYRDSERGQTIDASGNLDSTKFSSATGLGTALRNHPALPACLVKRVFAYGIGTDGSSANQPLLDYFNKRFAADGFQFPALLKTIVTSDAFRGFEQESQSVHPPAGGTSLPAEATNSSQR